MCGHNTIHHDIEVYFDASLQKLTKFIDLSSNFANTFTRNV